ncbi:MAG: histidine kinase dimerization/phospho-acceptor domain-containing protein [Leptolyngbya sp.]|nr:histidine kinase dimerization/phospho-acceptor domain-containing protein [Leptolyngbya sp.]
MAHPPLSLSQLFNQWADPSLPGSDHLRDGDLWPGAAGQSLEAQAQARRRAEQEWLGGIASLAQLLITRPEYLARPVEPASLGLVIAGPFPVLPDHLGGQALHHWLLVPEPLERILAVARPQLPGGQRRPVQGTAGDLPMIPLAPEDPLSQERFCLLLTADFSLVLSLGEGSDSRPSFRFSFDPAFAHQTWQQLRRRVAQVRPALLPTLDALVAEFPPSTPDYRLVTQYSHLLLQRLRDQAPPTTPVATLEAMAHRPSPPPVTRLGLAPAPRLSVGADIAMDGGLPAGTEVPFAPESGSDTELLKAMAHEIRTPLTTIRTLTRSLLKRKDVTEEVAKRLRSIDRECTQQIDRFNLIFRAVELETEVQQQPKSPLSAFPLDHLFQEAIPLWQQQASRRNHTLTVTLPPQLPLVHSDPTMLNQVLSGLIDRFTHSLPPYSHINLAVTLAGHQLKLQFQSQIPDATDPGTAGSGPNADALFSSPFKALGQLLIFQPETGGLSLNLQATKNLFQSLGGKLIVRQRPQAGEVLTVFLPLETRTL